MSTAVMFSGVDALDSPELRSLALQIPHVRRRFRQAEEVLGDVVGQDLDLASFVASDEATYNGNLPLKAFVSAVTHVGLFDLYLDGHPAPEYLVGCSLGDAARTTCSGALDFETMVCGTFLFNQIGQGIQDGAIVRVRADDGPLTEAQIREIEAEGLFVAVHQTPRHFLVSGSNEVLDSWVRLTAPREGFHVRPLYDKPLHSAGMSPALEAVKAAFAATAPRPWQIAMVSSVFTKVISTSDELVSDLERNMIGSVHWWQTFKWMADGLGVDRFVNIGPITTLIRFAERIPLDARVEVEDLITAWTGSSTGAARRALS